MSVNESELGLLFSKSDMCTIDGFQTPFVVTQKQHQAN